MKPARFFEVESSLATHALTGAFVPTRLPVSIDRPSRVGTGTGGAAVERARRACLPWEGGKSHPKPIPDVLYGCRETSTHGPVANSATVGMLQAPGVMGCVDYLSAMLAEAATAVWADGVRHPSCGGSFDGKFIAFDAQFSLSCIEFVQISS